MPTVAMVDVTYNNGLIPPNFALGVIEKKLTDIGVNVRVVDFFGSPGKPYSYREFLELEAEFVELAVEQCCNSDAVYISGSHGNEMKPYPMFPRIAKVSREIKKRRPDISIFFGGALANFYSTVLHIPDAIIKSKGIDVIHVGAEARVAGQLIEAIGQPDATTGDPVPDWQNWELGKYSPYLATLMQIGCPHKCSFCFEGKIFQPKESYAAVTQIVELVTEARERQTVNGLMIEDSIALSYPWFGGLADTMSAIDVPWAIYARSSEIVRHENKVRELYSKQCRSFIVGIEALENDRLHETNKKITSDQTLKALDICRDSRIAVQGCFILGFPDDSIDRIVNRIDAAVDLGLSTYRWHLLQPNWKELPSSIRGLTESSLEDLLEVQVSIPDSAVAEYLEEAPGHAMYDEHLMIRAMANHIDLSRLKNFGYDGQWSMYDLVRECAPKIQNIGLTVNEDDMYPILFDPSLAVRPSEREPESVNRIEVVQCLEY